MASRAPTCFGIGPTTAKDQLCKTWPPKVPVQPLPEGSPGRATPAQLGIREGKPLRFPVIGDSGGVKDPNPQAAVAAALAAEEGQQFVWHVGDWVYFNADAAEWEPQFYEPMAKVPIPEIGNAGNHDGDTTDNPNRKPLDTWMANLCSPEPVLPKGLEEYNRETQVQPYCDWTLSAQGLTIVALYTNVPSGGHLEPSQTDWLTSELEAAPKDRPLAISLHHPPFSIDAHHGGSRKMADALTRAIQASGRYPDLILSGHVHDYQRFTWTLDGHAITTLVVGASGYYHRHALAPGATPGEELAPGVVFEAGDADHWGYLKLTVGGGKIGGEYVGVAADWSVTPGLDSFTL